MSTSDEPGREERRVACSDRRWLLVSAAGFGASVALLLAAHALYRATGPHPQVTLFLRRLERAVRRAVPRLRPRSRWRASP